MASAAGSSRPGLRGTDRRGRRTLWVGVVALALACAVVLIALSASQGSDRTPPAAPGAGAALAALPQSGEALGRADAPVTITEYADLQCPFCARSAREVLPELIERWVRPGEVRMVFRPLAFLGPDSLRGALAATAAAAQDRMWNLVDALYAQQGEENSGWLTDDLLRRLAGEAGLSVPRFEAASDGAAARAAVARSAAAAKADGVTSTPSFLVSGPGGERVVAGAQPVTAFAAAIDEVAGQ